jgi:hypothetical protein
MLEYTLRLSYFVFGLQNFTSRIIAKSRRDSEKDPTRNCCGTAVLYAKVTALSLSANPPCACV